MRCSSVEQSCQNDARRLHRWLEYGSKAHLQRILSSSHDVAATQAHTKAASTKLGTCMPPPVRRGARGTESCRSSVEQSGQNDARRLHRWLEHGSKAHLQRILSGRFAAASRQAHAKAASTSSLVAVKSSAAEPSHCVAAPLSNQARTMPAAFTAGLSTAARPICSGFYPVDSLPLRGKRTQRRQAQAVSWR